MKTALITGVSGGIGKSLARRLAREYHVILVARGEQSLKELAHEIKKSGGAAEIIVADLTSKKRS